MSSKISGNLTLQGSNQPDLYGYGDLKLPSTVKFTNTSGSTSITNDPANTGGTFTIDSYNNMYIQARNDDLNIVTASSNSNSHVIAHALGTGTAQLELKSSGSGGVNLQTYHTSGNIVTTSSNQVTTTAAKQITMTAGDEINISTTAVDKNVTIRGGLTSGYLQLEAPTVMVGVANTNIVNIGNPSAQTNILGDLVVTGDFIKNDVINSSTKDNIVHQNTPAQLTHDTGILFDRNKNDVLAAPSTDPNLSLALTSQATAGLLYCYVGISAGSKLLTNVYVTLHNIANSEQQTLYVVVAVEEPSNIQKLSFSEALIYTFPTATTSVSVFTGKSAYIGYNCNEGVFELCTTNALPSDNNLTGRYKNLMDIKCNKVIATTGIYEVMETVGINTNNSIAVDITNTQNRGTYIISVQSYENYGACALFNCVKNIADGEFSIMRTVSVKCIHGEGLMVKWDANQKVQIYHDIQRATGGLNNLMYYKVKVSFTELL